jgi:hypothetical protein
MFMALLLMAGASAQVVITNKQFDLKKYKTFGFEPPDESFLKSHEHAARALERVQEAIRTQMEERGITFSDDPELLINVGITVEEKVQTRTTTVRDARYMGQRNYHWEAGEVPVGTYKEGTVTIDFIDATHNDLVNQAVATEFVVKNQKNQVKRINKMINKVFKALDKLAKGS